MVVVVPGFIAAGVIGADGAICFSIVALAVAVVILVLAVAFGLTISGCVCGCIAGVVDVSGFAFGGTAAPVVVAAAARVGGGSVFLAFTGNVDVDSDAFVVSIVVAIILIVVIIVLPRTRIIHGLNCLSTGRCFASHRYKYPRISRSSFHNSG